MSEQNDVLDSQLLALFAEAQAREQLDTEQFMQQMRHSVDRQYRRNIAWRVGMGLLLLLITTPMQDIAVALAPLFVTQIIDIPNQLVAQVLAPVNTVGAIVSLILLGVRLTQKKLMDRLAMS